MTRRHLFGSLPNFGHHQLSALEQACPPAKLFDSLKISKFQQGNIGNLHENHRQHYIIQMIWYWETWHPQKSDASGFGKSSSRGFYFTRLSRGRWMPTCCNLGFNQLNTPGWGERFGAMLLSTFPTWHGKNSTN